LPQTARRAQIPQINPVPADYDGDGKADLSVKTDQWLIDYASNGFGRWDASYRDYGGLYDQPVPADYDGDGQLDLRYICALLYKAPPRV
jgi:hypothetical protein